MIETVPSNTQPSRPNQSYPPPNLWPPTDYTSQQQQQMFMAGIQRPFPGVAPAPIQTVAPPTSATSINPLGILSGSSSSYLPNYSTMNPPMINNSTVTTSTFLDETSNFNHRHFAPLDANLAAIDLAAPAPFQGNTTSTNALYASQRIHTSPSGLPGYSSAYPYPPTAFNHHQHRHLSSNDEVPFLIQNPSFT